MESPSSSGSVELQEEAKFSLSSFAAMVYFPFYVAGHHTRSLDQADPPFGILLVLDAFSETCHLVPSLAKPSAFFSC